MAIVGRTTSNAQFRNMRMVVLAVVTLFTLYTLAPLFYVVVSSTKDTSDLFSTFGLWFAEENKFVETITGLFTHRNGIFTTWLWNTFWYSSVAAILSTITAALCGYALAKYRFKGRGFIFAIILGSVMVPGTAMVIPLFLMLSSIGLVDTPWAAILPSVVSPLGVFLMRIYSEQGVPDELLEAARVDGAGELRIFLSIASRLLVPGLVTVLLLSFVGTWNNYFLPLVMLSSQDLLPITVGLAIWYEQAVIGLAGAENLYAIVLAGSLVSIVPIIAVFIILQRYWQSGLTAGSVK